MEYNFFVRKIQAETFDNTINNIPINFHMHKLVIHIYLFILFPTFELLSGQHGKQNKLYLPLLSESN